SASLFARPASVIAPPSRALGPGGPPMVVPEARKMAPREAGPRRRDTATARGGPCAAFGPAPAAFPPSQRRSEGVSLLLLLLGHQAEPRGQQFDVRPRRDQALAGVEHLGDVRRRGGPRRHADLRPPTAVQAAGLGYGDPGVAPAHL